MEGDESIEIYCRIGRIVGKALEGLVRSVGYSLEDLRSVEIDTYGPRFVLVFEKEEKGVRSVLDFSPDGCEHEIRVRIADREYGDSIAEALDAIIGGRVFEGVEDYDVYYDSVDGSLVVSLYTMLLAEQPSVENVLSLLHNVLGERERSNGS